MKVKCRFWLQPFLLDLRKTNKLVSSTNPSETLWKDFEPSFGWSHHFLMIIPERMRARSTLYNPVGGPAAAAHKQALSPPPSWKAHGGRVCLPHSLSLSLLSTVSVLSWKRKLSDGFHTRWDESPRQGSTVKLRKYCLCLELFSRALTWHLRRNVHVLIWEDKN